MDGGDEPLAGRRIGPYRLQRELGRGGMGSVFLATRDDDAYLKQVAIKVVRGAGDDLVRRFQQERQILASLDHPNIARLLDGGTTGDGVPWLVMEYVEGEPIDHWCARQQLDVRGRLRLFRSVCAAVQHAHGKLIVHRDLKPSNILVTASGEPKLLDFGIAKLLDPSGSGTPQTATALALTPEYASPEQARGEPLTTATDVYTLGVVLYELLAGRRPFVVPPGAAPLDVLRAVCEQDPLPPSQSTPTPAASHDEAPTLRQLTSAEAATVPAPARRRQLRGDIDNIVLMALAKEPARRYPSVEAFSEDVQRHLDGLPVRARAATARYRLGKFLRRHRVAVTALAAAVVVVAAFVTALWRQADHLAAERDRAERERDRATRVSNFMAELFEESDPEQTRGQARSARDVLDRGAARLRDQLRDDPDVRATLLGTIGVVYLKLGQQDAARPLLEESLATRRQRLGDHPDTAQALTAMGEWRASSGDGAAGLALFREALGMRRRLHGSEHPEVASALTDLAALLSEDGKLDEAATLHQEALAMHRRIHGPEHREVSIALGNIAFLHFQKGEYGQAARLFRETLEMQRRLLGPDHPLVTAALNNLASSVFQLGDFKEAEKLFRESLELHRRVLGPGHPDVARGLRNLGNVLEQLGDDAGAEAAYREAIAIRRKALGPAHPDVARTMVTLASVLQGRDQAEAERLAREALGWPTALPPVVEGEARLVLARIESSQGRSAGAIGHARRALTLRQKAYPAGHWSIAVAQRDLGVVLLAAGQRGEGRAALEAAHARLRQVIGDARRETQLARRALDAVDAPGSQQ